REALERFLHPLHGGPDSTGWAFGRDVFLSELFAALEELPGVEHVRSLAFQPTVSALPLTFKPAGSPAGSFPVGSTLTTSDGLLAAVLTEPVAAGPPLSTAMVVLLQAGERLQVGDQE